MFRHSFRFLAIGAAATVAALTMGMGVAQAKPVQPINPCVISPNACQKSPPIVHVDPCVIDPSLCPPQPQPQPQPPKQGNGSPGNSGQGSSSTGGSASDPGSGSATLTGTPAAVHRVAHSSGGSDNSTLVLGASGALAASLAGLAGLAVWRRRAVA